MKGNLHYFVNDKSGSPLFFMLKEAQVDLIRIIPELIAKTRQIIKEYTSKVEPFLTGEDGVLLFSKSWIRSIEYSSTPGEGISLPK